MSTSSLELAYELLETFHTEEIAYLQCKVLDEAERCLAAADSARSAKLFSRAHRLAGLRFKSLPQINAPALNYAALDRELATELSRPKAELDAELRAEVTEWRQLAAQRPA